MLNLSSPFNSIFRFSKISSMLPPARKRDSPKRLDPHPPGSKHELVSTRVKKHAEKKKQRDIKRKQRDKGNVEKENMETEEVAEDNVVEDHTMETDNQDERKEV